MFTYSFRGLSYRILARLALVLSEAKMLFASNDESVAVTQIEDDIATRAAMIMDTYGNSVLRYAYSYMHNMEDSEDILQETLIMFMRKAPVFESDSHAKAWLFTVAGNIAKNKLKYNEIRRHDDLNEELVGENKEDLSFIWEAVKSLPDEYREVIHLFYEEDFTTAQISDVLKRKESTVRSQLKRAREKLKVVLKEVYDFGE